MELSLVLGLRSRAHVLSPNSCSLLPHFLSFTFPIPSPTPLETQKSKTLFPPCPGSFWQAICSPRHHARYAKLAVLFVHQQNWGSAGPVRCPCLSFCNSFRVERLFPDVGAHLVNW